MRRTLHRRSGLAALAAAVGLILAGCGSSVGLTTSTGGGMAKMQMGDSGGTGAVPEVNGIKPVATQVLATSYWQGMKIQARTMTPVKFVVFDGTSERTVIPPKHASFHLMVMLTDRHTGVAIPYASVWATILNGAGKVVYDERQWPMLSEYMGPHYGNNVALPDAGRYTLKLLVSPPVAARHLEYAHVWLHQHEVLEHFTWKPTT